MTLDVLRFFSQLTERNEGQQAYNFKNIEKWILKLPFNILDCELLFIPRGFRNNHWVLILIDVKKSLFFCYNSRFEG